MDSLVDIFRFYEGKIVFVTGHTGFKGSWLTKILLMAGAKVIGYSLEAPTKPNLFSLLNIEKDIVSIIGDVRDYAFLLESMLKHKPEFVFHMAAQPLVRESYTHPRYTYEVNVIGTVNICEAIRFCDSVKSFVNITTDKVYENQDNPNTVFCEDDKLDGYDPYSNSKSCSELVTSSYYKSFLKEKSIAVSTARAGNVIGGGDFSADRIIPDCVRAIENGKALIIRNPKSIRPYQHVIEPLICYLEIAKKQHENADYCGSYNIGPEVDDCIETQKLVQIFGENFDSKLNVELKNSGGPHEAAFLRLDTTKIKKFFSWVPLMKIETAVQLTAEWFKYYFDNDSVIYITEQQIERYLEK